MPEKKDATVGVAELSWFNTAIVPFAVQSERQEDAV